MAEVGWIKLYRRIRDHWLWNKKPWDETHMWIELLIRANFEESAIPNPSKVGPVLLKPGELIVSLGKLAGTAGWGKKRVLGFLRGLEKDTMIETVPGPRYTIVKILNYKAFQISDTNKGTDQGTDQGTAEEPLTARRRSVRRNPSKEGKEEQESARVDAYKDILQGASPPEPPNTNFALLEAQRLTASGARRALSLRGSIALPADIVELLEQKIKDDDERLRLESTTIPNQLSITNTTQPTPPVDGNK